MSMIRCKNGHYYESDKHTQCPYCGVQNVDFMVTQAHHPSASPRTVKEAKSEDIKTRGVSFKTYRQVCKKKRTSSCKLYII
jgi:hypothetical protein